jgi:hypothetical protein
MPSSAAVHVHLQRKIASYTEHGWNHTRMLLDIAHEEVDIHTHGIIHLEHHVEAQDAELEERAKMITNLEQQLLEL